MTKISTLKRIFELRNVLCRQSSTLTRTVFLLAFIVGYGQFAQAQNGQMNWNAEVSNSKSFIKNLSQFDVETKFSTEPIEYVMDHGSTKIYFSEKGLTYRMFTTEKKYEDEKDEEFLEGLSHVEKEREERKLIATTDFVYMQWLGANPNVKIEALEQTPDYHSYSFGDTSINEIPAFKKLIYRNLYPNTDVIYEFHPEDGIKYSVILHPGADASNVKMTYSSADGMSLSADGKLHLPTRFGDIIEHQPLTFYTDDTQPIASRFAIDGNTVGFNLDQYDASRSVTIDPWVQTPTLPNSNGVWEVDVDAAGNVYIIGGEMDMKLLKYSPAGALQWTYNTAYDTTSWLGTFATDAGGASYVSLGSTAAMKKVSTAAAQQWSFTSTGLSDEYWSISFNCDQSKLVVGGTSGGFTALSGTIFDINTASGGVTGSQIVTTSGLFGIPPSIQEIRAITPSKNSRYYFLTLDTIGAIDQNFSACPTPGPTFMANSGYALGYKSENYRPNNGNSGIKAIRANDQFVYTQNGTTVHQRSLGSGAILATAAIPGGQSTTSLGQNVIGNCGIDLDDCGNVYVGSSNGVYKFSANLAMLSSAPTSFKVSDVRVNYNGEVVACGSTGTGATVNRTGYIQSFNMGSCAPVEHICCNPNICPQDPLCETDPPVTLIAGDPGGVWSGNGITNTATGVFDPSVAGPGVHTIVYTLPCGADTTEISVSPCQPLEVCLEPNGDLTVLNGTAPFTWESESSVQDCSSCLFGCAVPPGCAVNATAWASFGTGVTVTPPSYPIRVTDAVGDELVITAANTLPPCTECETPTVTGVAQNPLCLNGTDGAIDLTVTGPSTYGSVWSSGPTTEDINNLTAGTYTVTVTDQTNSSCDTVVDFTLTNGGSPTITALTLTAASCGNADGEITITATSATQFSTDGGTTFQGTGVFTGLASGPYTIVVEDGNGCQKDTVATVTNANGPVIDALASTDPNCGATDGTIDITASGGAAPLTYSTDNGVTFQSTGQFGSLSAGTFDIIVEDASGCQATDQVQLSSNGGPTIDNVTPTDPTCGSTNGQIVITASGGTPPLQYSVDNGTTFQATGTFANLGAGVYDVIVDDGAGCPATQQLTLGSSGGATITNVATTDATCGQPDGQLDITATGGTAPLQYSIDNGVTFQGSAQFTGLLAGNYTVVVSDANGCETSQAASVANTGAPTISIIVETDALCKGSCDATITISANGATLYSVDNGATFQPTGNFTGICAGNFTVVVDDGAGCQAFGQATVSEPTVVTSTIITTDALCSGSCDGAITVTANGGTPIYQYSIDGGVSFQAAGNFQNVCDGNYSVVVEDANGCQITSADVVSVPNPITFTFVTTDVSCFGQCDGSATAAVSGGTAPYTYLWSANTGTSTTNIILCAGNQTLTISDASGCSVDTAFVIVQPPLLVIEDVTVVDESCALDCNGSIIIQAPLAATFSIDGGATFHATADFLDLCPGNYEVIVADATGCEATQEIQVVAGLPVIGSFIPRPDVVPELDSEILFDNNSTGAVAYTWHFGDGSYSNEENPRYDFGNQPGTYLVCLAADNGDGCIDTACAYVDVTPLFTMYVPNAFSPNASTDINDEFRPIFTGERPETYHLRIFNRWGDKIFETNNIEKGWDGMYEDKLVESGVYVWLIDIKREEGGKNRQHAGHVTRL